MEKENCCPSQKEVGTVYGITAYDYAEDYTEKYKEDQSWVNIMKLLDPQHSRVGYLLSLIVNGDFHTFQDLLIKRPDYKKKLYEKLYVPFLFSKTNQFPEGMPFNTLFSAMVYYQRNDFIKLVFLLLLQEFKEFCKSQQLKLTKLEKNVKTYDFLLDKSNLFATQEQLIVFIKSIIVHQTNKTFELESQQQLLCDIVTFIELQQQELLNFGKQFLQLREIISLVEQLQADQNKFIEKFKVFKVFKVFEVFN